MRLTEKRQSSCSLAHQNDEQDNEEDEKHDKLLQAEDLRGGAVGEARQSHGLVNEGNKEGEQLEVELEMAKSRGARMP